MEKVKYSTSKYELNSEADIKNLLLLKFLLYGDSDAIQILLNIYKIEDHIENINFDYTSMQSLIRDVATVLRHREDRFFIAYNLSQLIQDDVHRFELVSYLNGYLQGLKSYEKANHLEIQILREMELNDIYRSERFHQFINYSETIVSFNERLYQEIKHSQRFLRFGREQVYAFNRTVLKKKVYSLNGHVDRQLSINLDGDSNSLIDVREMISRRELHEVNQKVVHFLIRDYVNIYKRAYLNGILDIIRKRYNL